MTPKVTNKHKPRTATTRTKGRGRTAPHDLKRKRAQKEGKGEKKKSPQTTATVAGPGEKKKTPRQALKHHADAGERSEKKKGCNHARVKKQLGGRGQRTGTTPGKSTGALGKGEADFPVGGQGGKQVRAGGARQLTPPQKVCLLGRSVKR